MGYRAYELKPDIENLVWPKKILYMGRTDWQEETATMVKDATRIADYLVATMERTNREIQGAMKGLGIEEKGATGFLIFGQGGGRKLPARQHDKE